MHSMRQGETRLPVCCVVFTQDLLAFCELQFMLLGFSQLVELEFINIYM